MEGKEIISSLELLSRGAFTQTSTMVSTEYADSVYAVIKKQGCVTELPTGEEMVDMVIFKKQLISGNIDVNLFNDSFKYNLEDEPEDEDP